MNSFDNIAVNHAPERRHATTALKAGINAEML
jgi:hypothetical protein